MLLLLGHGLSLIAPVNPESPPSPPGSSTGSTGWLKTGVHVRLASLPVDILQASLPPG